MKLRRQLDAVPGNSELNQYQRRFTELCTQGFFFSSSFFGRRFLFLRKTKQKQILLLLTVNEKQTELNGYYLLYNTLEDTKVYLNKELSLLTSIHDSFSQSMTSSAGKGEFLQQMEKIVTAVRQNKNKVRLFIRKFVNNFLFLFNNSHFFRACGFLFRFIRSRSRSKC